MLFCFKPRSHLTLAAVSACLTMVPGSPAWAADATSTWSGSAELGASLSTGNSQTSSLNGQLKLKYESGPWSHRFKLSTLQAREDGNATANRTVGELSTRYAYDERNYAFDSLRASHDAFSGYSYQASVAAGLGRKFWVSERGELTAELGPGYRRSKIKNGQTENNLIGRANAHLTYKISDTAKFEQSLTMLAGSANTELESETGLSVNVTKTVALKVAYTVQHNSHVPAGTKKTDTFTSVNLVYAFGDT